MEESDVSLVHVDGTQDEDAIMEMEKLEESLHFKTTSTGIVVGQDVKDYPPVLTDWYRNKEEQVHVTEADWNFVGVPIKVGEWVLEWSSCDPQQCWVELWKLWVEGGIRIQLGYQQCHVEMSDDEDKDQCFSSSRRRLPRHRSTLQWTLSRLQ
jgi:hypothetical protein